MATTKKSVTKSFTTEIQEIEFPESENQINFYRVNDTVVIIDKDEGLSMTLSQICEKLADLYSEAEYGTYENDVLLITKHYFEQLLENVE